LAFKYKIQICSSWKKPSVTANFSLSSFTFELPRFRLYEAIIRLYVYKKMQTLNSLEKGPLLYKYGLKIFIQYKTIGQKYKNSTKIKWSVCKIDKIVRSGMSTVRCKWLLSCAMLFHSDEFYTFLFSLSLCIRFPGMLSVWIISFSFSQRVRKFFYVSVPKNVQTWSVSIVMLVINYNDMGDAVKKIVTYNFIVGLRIRFDYHVVSKCNFKSYHKGVVCNGLLNLRFQWQHNINTMLKLYIL
jgi:hypothetical protein